MFIAALFTIAKVWKQPKCPSTDEWIQEMWYTYTMECYSVIKKNGILPFAAMWMDLENIMLSEMSQTEKDKQCMTSLICGIKEIKQTNVYINKETDSQIQRTNQGLPVGREK